MQYTGPTFQQIKIVKTQWSYLRNVNAGIIGDVFYGKLFFDYPQTRKPFDRMVAAQCIDDRNESLKTVISAIIVRLDQPEQLKKFVNGLSISWKAHGLGLTAFQQLASCLIWTIRKAFGDGWSPADESAWGACIVSIKSYIFKL